MKIVKNIAFTTPRCRTMSMSWMLFDRSAEPWAGPATVVGITGGGTGGAASSCAESGAGVLMLAISGFPLLMSPKRGMMHRCLRRTCGPRTYLYAIEVMPLFLQGKDTSAANLEDSTLPLDTRDWSYR